MWISASRPYPVRLPNYKSLQTIATGCTTTREGSVTTVTVNLRRLKHHAFLWWSAAHTVESLLGVLPQCVPYMMLIKIMTQLGAGFLDTFANIAGGRISIQYDTAAEFSKAYLIRQEIRMVVCDTWIMLSTMVRVCVPQIPK